MNSQFLRRIPLLLAVGLLGACASAPPAPTAVAPCGGVTPFAQGGERATLWVKHAAEFRAAASATYKAALQATRSGLDDPSWTAEPSQSGSGAALPAAVIMDIDDTMLDNSEAQARMLLQVTCPEGFPALWDAWLAERAAPGVPGAVEFVREVRKLRDGQGRAVRVIFITNRECSAREGNTAPCPQEDDTLANLRSLGLDSPTLADDLMLKSEHPDWPSEKLSRRQTVTQDFRVLVNMGDDLGDFIPGVRRLPMVQREAARCQYADWWGTKWFVVPNPMYGSWEHGLGMSSTAALQARQEPPGC